MNSFQALAFGVGFRNREPNFDYLSLHTNSIALPMLSSEPDQNTIVTQLRKVFPKTFFESIAAILREVYAESTMREMNRLTGYRRQQVVGMSRYAYVEEEVLKLSGPFQVRDISIKEEKGEGGAKHVEIKAGSFVLTFAYTQRPDKFIKPSKYRTNLALNNQLSLFNSSHNSSDLYYGIIIHGPMETAGGYDYLRPGFLKLAFPDSKFSGYATQHVDLLSVYNIDLAPIVVDNTEKIADHLRLKLKPGASKGEKT